jgi:hypothetical protein
MGADAMTAERITVGRIEQLDDTPATPDLSQARLTLSPESLQAAREEAQALREQLAERTRERDEAREQCAANFRNHETTKQRYGHERAAQKRLTEFLMNKAKDARHAAEQLGYENSPPETKQFIRKVMRDLASAAHAAGREQGMEEACRILREIQTRALQRDSPFAGGGWSACEDALDAIRRAKEAGRG